MNVFQLPPNRHGGNYPMKARICSTAPRTSADNTGEVRAVSTEGVRGKHSTKIGLPFTESGVVTCSIRGSFHSRNLTIHIVRR